MGDRVPSVTLGRVGASGIDGVALQPMLALKRAVLVGVVGAFTPICTKDHTLEFITNAPRLRAMGYDPIICIAPNDPWTVAAWEQSLGDTAGVVFLSDGNLDLARAIGVTVTARDLHLGERPRRYLLLVHDNVIHRMTVEPDGTSLTCTGQNTIVEGG
jgi:peroxiredoxin